MENMSESKKSLNDNIEHLSETIERVSSYKFVFLRGVVTGIGTFIGATIIAAIAITIVVQFFDFLGLEGYIESFLPKNR